MKKSHLLWICAVGIVCIAAVVVLLVILPGSRGVRSTIFVERVEGLGPDFMLGADVSSIISLEDSGVRFFDAGGQEADLFTLLAAGGTNYIRVRIWNDPWYAGADGVRRGFGGGNNDAARAMQIGLRATAAGQRVLLNFHYSDFWADPSKQMAPRAWVGMSVDEKVQALYDFTYQTVLDALRAGVDIGMVQIGNETNNGMAGVTDWDDMLRLFDAGSRAVMDAERAHRTQQGMDADVREIMIAIHKTNPEDRGFLIRAAQTFAMAGITYDVFGLSYYNFWHGSLENLLDVMNVLSRMFDVDVAVFETSYPFTAEDTDGHPNSFSGYDFRLRYPISVQGQAHAIRDVVAAVASVDNGRGIGVFLWEPAWITVGPPDRAANEPIWLTHGSGWASVYATSYDPYDAGVYWGGTSWDNQAFFDHNGHPLATLNLFNYVRTGARSRAGNHMEMPISTASEVNISYDLTAAWIIENLLPTQVDVVFANNDVLPVDVAWDSQRVADALHSAREAGGINTFLIDGTATHGTNSASAAHTLTILPAGNLVRNGDFEDDDMSMWRVTFYTPDGGYANRGSENVHAGNFGFRFWRAANQEIHFSLEQDFTALAAGTYGFEVFLTGGDAGSGYEIYVYALINGQPAGRQDSRLPGWNNWENPGLRDIHIAPGDTLTIGARLFFPNTAGAWGTLDDFFLYLVD